MRTGGGAGAFRHRFRSLATPVATIVVEGGDVVVVVGGGGATDVVDREVNDCCCYYCYYARVGYGYLVFLC